MAHNPSLALRATSPASSDGSPHRGNRGRKAQDDNLSKDKSFRRYAAGVERALGLFDTTPQEWADYISFLSRLHKALQNHPDGVSTIPRKYIVSKRLAQCLHPSLPSGVHQKALEVYGLIFALIGVGGLTNDLGVYLPGIASTLTFASISVRPLFLSLVEDYVLEIPSTALRPALKALILALLPGLEDETSDEFERTLQTLNRCKRTFSSAGGGEVFWQNLFLASITSPSRRHGALAYLNRYLPKLGNPEPGLIHSVEDEDPSTAESVALTTPEPGLLLRCFVAGLSDEQALVQRAFLDLLVTHLPLNALIFRGQVVPEDLDLLISAAVGVVLRRDMSLNRRLWSWFMGPELVQRAKNESMQSQPGSLTVSNKQVGEESPDVASYFPTYCAQALIRTLEAMIATDSRVPSRVSRPFRIALSLMDRWEIGGPVVNAIFLPLIRCLRNYQDNAKSQKDFDDVFRSANVFFDGVESILIWFKMLGLLVPTGKAKEATLPDLDLAAFVIANFNMAEEEMVMLQIPLVCLAMLECLSQSEKSASDRLSPQHDREVRSKMLQLLTLMIDMIPNRAFASRSSAFPKAEAPWVRKSGLGAIQQAVKLFFDRNQDAVELSEPPFSVESLGKLLLSLLTPMILTQITVGTDGSEFTRHIQLFSLLLEKLPKHDGLDIATLVEALKQRLAFSNHAPGHLHFAPVSAATMLCIKFFKHCAKDQVIGLDDIAVIVPLLVQHLWAFLSFSFPQHHIETVRLLNDLQQLVWREELVTSTICTIMVEAGIASTESYRPNKEGLERFATLWTLTPHDLTSNGRETDAETNSPRMPTIDASAQPIAAFSSMLNSLMVSVLSVLRNPDAEVYATCLDWLQSVSDLSSIFESILTPIRKSLSLDNNAPFTAPLDSLERCNDMMDILNHLVAAQSREQWLNISHRRGPKSSNVKVTNSNSLQTSLIQLCREVMQRDQLSGNEINEKQFLRLQRAALRLVGQLFNNSDNEPLLAYHIDQSIVRQLGQSIAIQNTHIQSYLLDTLLLILNAKIIVARSQEVARGSSVDEGPQESRRSLNNVAPTLDKDKLAELPNGPYTLVKPPDELLSCLLKGLANPSSQDMIRKWIQILCQSTYLYTTSTFVVLMSIIECLCRQIEVCLEGMKEQYEKRSDVRRNFESPLLHLLNGLDFVLARAHEQLLSEEEESSTIKSPELQQGFFGSMVSGSQLAEAKQARSTTNNRLTVILCFQDALKTCFEVWSWQGSDMADSVETFASFQHISQKMRNRSRKIIEHLLAAESLEGIEVLADIWVKAFAKMNSKKAASLLDIVHTMEGSRPQITMGATFNAIYTRTNPSALGLNQKSTLSSNLQESDLVAFMSVYTQSLEDDVLEEIWKDCTTFLRDVLGNPMPHRHILARLISFIAILSAKMENTNFGEEWKMRRELGDLFVRLLTAIYTIKPQNSSRERIAGPSVQSGQATGLGSDSVDQILNDNFATFSSLLGESDRLVAVMVNLVSNIIAPLFRSRLFPQNLNSTTLSLLHQVSRVPNASKAWKKELMDAFNDARFFSSPMLLVKDGWHPLLRQLALAEKGLLPELLSRLTAPTAAGIMFGVGAAAARLEADKKTQLNLRRIVCVLLAVDHDTFTPHLAMLQSKVEELLTASSISSPSSLTRAEIFMAMRALVLKSSAGQMASFWPLLNAELQTAFSSVFADNDRDETTSSSSSGGSTYTSQSLLQAAKLLDVLLLTHPEDFQPQEWLFVTDTIDAIYRPDGWQPSALIDEVAQSMMDSGGRSPNKAMSPPPDEGTQHEHEPDNSSSHSNTPLRKPWLSGPRTRLIRVPPPRNKSSGDAKTEIDIDSAIDMDREIRDGLLRPFFHQLSIHVYERTYSLSEPDLQACRDDLWADLFEERTLVGG